MDQEIDVAGPSRPKSPRIESSFLENLRASLKEITSEIKSLLVESQKEMLKLPNLKQERMLGKTLKRKRKTKQGVSTPLLNQLGLIPPKTTMRT